MRSNYFRIDIAVTVKNKFSQAEIRARRIKRLAEIIFDHWEEGSGMDTRFFDHPFIHNDYVINGQSIQGGTYREHIVPRVYLRNACLKMYENEASVDEVAAAISAHLSIVRITVEEAQILNKAMRDSMPEGWIFGRHDPMERLNTAGIKLLQNKAG